MKIYAMGGFGCGNLGDEAIFQAMRLEFPELIPIYVNKPYGMVDYDRPRYWEGEDSAPYIWYADLIDYGFPADAEGGELILGGGGIFHSKQTVEDLLAVSEQAKKRGMRISVRRVGADYLSPDFEEETKKVLGNAYFISARSSFSVEIVKRLGFNCTFERDYAYNLTDWFFKEEVDFPKFEENRPLIGVVTAGNDNMATMNRILRALMIREWQEFPMCNILHIPHSRHYTDWVTNDVIGGEVLWSGVNIYHGKRWVRYKQLPFPETVEKLMNAYTKVDGIIGMRYHSFIFSEMLNVPMLAVVSGKKAAGHFINNNPPKTVRIDSNASEDEYKASLVKFFQMIPKKG